MKDYKSGDPIITKSSSELLKELYKCSPKFIEIIYNCSLSHGPIMIYSNYVRGEGIELFKVYLEFFGYKFYNKEKKDYFTYVEYHSGIDSKQRVFFKNAYNNVTNKDGKEVKIILLSPAGSEGIELRNTRQCHIMEPYWNETRITQVIGRVNRQCSHKDLPMKDRIIDIFRYKMIMNNTETKNSTNAITDAKETADEIIEDLALKKENTINLFKQLMKEAAIDCNLFKAHNMMDNKYTCFQFNEPSYFVEPTGEIYRQDDGLNSITSITKNIKVLKIKCDNQLSYWYSPETHTIYDLDLEYPVGKIKIEDNIPVKLNKETYVIDKMINIPLLK